MTLEESVKAIADRIPTVMPHIQTEQATKTALIVPFIEALGYDRLNPAELVPEYTADVGVKSGEKVDYAILRDGEPIILIECKVINAPLNSQHASQLLRYFSTTTARIGILTNGIVYQFYADLDRPNRMDSKPFFEVDLTKIDDSVFPELQRFAKGTFNVMATVQAASELKYTNEIKLFLSQQLQTPDREFVHLLMKQVYSGGRTRQATERFMGITKAAFTGFINDRVYDRLRVAMSQGGTGETETPAPEVVEDKGTDTSAIVTTEEEMEGFYIVKSILREVIAPNRITLRDQRSYCNVLLDNNARKRICRLYFNNLSQKRVGISNNEGDDDFFPVDTVDGIYSLADRLRDRVRSLEMPSATASGAGPEPTE